MLYKKLHSFRVLSATLTLALVLSMPSSPAFLAYAQEGDTPVVDQNPPAQDAAPQTNSSQSGDTSGSNGTDQTQSQPATDGQSGDTGSDANAGTTDADQGTDGDSSSTPAEVTTGDASSSSDSGNTANENNVTTGDSGSTDVSVNNDATVENAADTTAATGDNSATGNGASVETGDAFAEGNAINVVNTNIIDSNGMLLFLNTLFGGGLDLRSFDLSYFFGGGGTSGTQNGCTFMGCNNASLNVDATNNATVTNSVVVRAMTGGNTANGGDGNADVTTGNAYAAGNAVNLVNSNIIDSNYLLVSFNNFGDLANDIVLPGADFFQQLLAHNAALPPNTEINTNNNATLNTSTDANASSGDNTASSTEGGASVSTGTALAGSSSYNQVNSTLIGGTQVFFLFRIWGEFTGNIQGLPEGMGWQQTPYGIQLTNSDGSAASTNALANAGGNCCGGSSLTASTTNNAVVNNNVNVYALTGDNKAESDEGDATVSTGNAYASANSVNIVNTNLIGRNWIFAIFNIFGNFSGNISFGHPDLWIGASAETGNPTLPGQDITYHFTVSNRGDADATNVKLNAKYLRDYLHFADGTDTNDGESWDLGTLKHGETKEFVYHAQAGTVPGNSSVAVPLEATLSSNETDNNTEDNTEHLDIVISNPQVTSWSGPGRAPYTADPHITMQKIASQAATSSPANIDYAIIIENDGGDAYNVKVTDTLTGPFGNFVGDQSWNLGTLKSGEEVRVTYTVQFGADIAPGIYKNVAVLTGQKNNSVAQYATDIVPVQAVNLLEMRPHVEGEVLGASTAACEPLLRSYIRAGHLNNPGDVKKLQNFLTTTEGENLGDGSGDYDNSTISAVKRFQQKYLNDILAPWGISQPTGSVYYTTKKKINEMNCENALQFPLEPEQVQEIENFKTHKPSNLEEFLKNHNVGKINTPNRDVLAPVLPGDAVPVMQQSPKIDPKKPQSESTNLFFNAFKLPMSLFGSWMVSMTPFAAALEE